MSRTKKPTVKQRNLFRLLLNSIRLSEKTEIPLPSLGELMLKAGYARTTAINPQENVISKEGFQTLLNTVLTDEKLIGKMNEIIGSDDKRAALVAIDMSWKLKDKYPKRETRAIGLFMTLQKYGENDEEN